MTNVIVIIEIIEEVNVEMFTIWLRKNFCKVKMCMLYAFFANQKFLYHLYIVYNYLRILSVYWVYWLVNYHSVECLGVLARVVHNMSYL